MTLLFVTTAPIMSVFGCLFFLIKYHVDKYNIKENFAKDFESQGDIGSSVTNYLIFSFLCL